MFFLEGVCTICEVINVLVFIKKIMKIIFILVPILLIVFLSIDFMKSVISNSEEDARKNISLAFKRIFAAVLLFLVPSIVNITMNVLENAGIKGATYYLLATEENVNSEIFKDWEMSGIDGNYKINSIKSGDLKVASNKTFKLKKSNITLGHYTKKVNKYTITITNKSGSKINNNKFNFKSNNPAIAKVSSSGVITARFGGKTTITITSKDTNEKATANVTVVHSLYTRAKTTKALKVKEIVSGKSVELASGTTGILNGIGPTKYSHSYTKGNILKVGNKYYSVPKDSVKSTKYYIEQPYSKTVVEDFVNSFGFSSKTKYLLWGNHGSQTLYFFKGSKGKWKLTKIDNVGPTMAIATGDILGFVHSECDKTRPCPTGVIFDNKIKNTYNLANYSKKLIRKRGNPLHQTWGGKIGTPLSHGCTRVKSIDKLLGIHSKIKNSRYIDY